MAIVAVDNYGENRAISCQFSARTTLELVSLECVYRSSLSPRHLFSFIPSSTVYLSPEYLEQAACRTDPNYTHLQHLALFSYSLLCIPLLADLVRHFIPSGRAHSEFLEWIDAAQPFLSVRCSQRSNRCKY